MRLFFALIFVSSVQLTEDCKLDFLLKDVAESQVDALEVTVAFGLFHYAEEVCVNACLVFQFGNEIEDVFLRCHW